MSFRSKIMLVPVLTIGAVLAVLAAVHFWGPVVAIAPAAAAAILIIMLTRNLLITSADSVDRMNRTVTALTEGRMDMTLRADAKRESGEVGELENGLATLAINHHNFINDLEDMVTRTQNGEENVKMETKDLSAGLRDIATYINTITAYCEKTYKAVIDATERFARGDFTPNLLVSHPKAAEAVENMHNRLQMLKKDTAHIARAAKEGDLTARTEGVYHGEWLHITSDLNAVMEAASRPVTELVSALERFESANLSSSFSGYVQGDYLKVKEALERVGALFAGCINELASSLNELPAGRESSLKRAYPGALQSLQSAFNNAVRAYERLTDDLNKAKAAQAAPPRPIRPITGTTPVRNTPATPLRTTPGVTPAAPLRTVPGTAPVAPGRTAPGTAPISRTAPATPVRTTPGAPPPRTALGAGAAAVRSAINSAVSGVRSTPAGALRPTTPARPTPPKTAVNTPPLPVSSGKVIIPSGAHEYNRKDFGKYK